MNEPTSPTTLSPLTSLANTPRLLSPEPPCVRVKRVHIKREEPPSEEPPPNCFPLPIQRPQLHSSVLTLSHLRRRRLRHNLPRDLVSISKICRDLQERVNDVPVPIIPTVPSFPHLRSAGPVNVYQDAVAAAKAATEDAERITDIKIQLELHAHELEVMRDCVFERFEDLFDAERQKILKMQVDCCFRDLQELQVEINHRIWSGRLRQPLQPLGKVHVSLPTGSEGKRRGRGREWERGREQAGERSVPARGVAMGSAVDMDLNVNMDARFEGIDWPEFTDEQIADILKEMEEDMLDEPVDWEEILRAEARTEDRPVKREPEDDGMQLDDVDETETVKGDHAKGEEVHEERTKEDADMKEPEESIWSEESGGVDTRAYLSLAHPCDPGGGWSWNPAWGRRQ